MLGKLRDLRRSRRLWLLLIPLLAVAGWFGVGAVAYAASLRLYMVPSTSMAPTIARGDRICVETGRKEPPRRGEVWVFHSPGGTPFVKRVIGLPGEQIEVEGGRVKVDGVPLSEPYLPGPMSYAMPPRRLNPGEYFMLGDSRNGSNDSHVWGPVPRRELIGRVRFRYWPGGRVGGLK